ncbi:MAG: 50S ribosomal protein L9 [Chloroflexi bacterium]|nr:50S ribosomal protein L9 [Chloroflexota bacterium]
MRVIFLEDIPNVARTGDVKEVKTGYARNYLLPKRLAVAATPQEMARLESIRRAGLERQSKLKEGAQAMAQRLESASVVLKARCGPNGRLYGAVTNAMVAQELSTLMDAEFDRRDVQVDDIHDLGSFQAKVRLLPELTATVNLVVEPLQEQE